MAGVESGLWVLLAALVIGSGIGLYYYLRIVYCMLTPATDKTPLPFSGVESLSSHSVLAILFVLLLVLGVYPAPVMAIIETISAFI
jgi:NADH-quinone oxidoreductase subunit N